MHCNVQVDAVFSDNEIQCTFEFFERAKVEIQISNKQQKCNLKVRTESFGGPKIDKFILALSTRMKILPYFMNP